MQVGLLGRSLGMDEGGVLMATCIASAVAALAMGLWANYPIALAPGMGENFYFALTLAPAMAALGTGQGWQMALALTAVAGLVFLMLSAVNFRAKVLNAIPDSLKSGIAAGIGLFIAVVGMNYGHLVVKAPGGGLTQLAPMRGNYIAWLTLLGLAVTLMLMAFRLRGAILVGILATTVVGILWGKIDLNLQIVAVPTGLQHTAGGFGHGFVGVWQALGDHWPDILIALFVLLFMDLFDTVGTLVGVARRAGLMDSGRLPRAERALAADATGTVVGAFLGTSTVTSYIESVTGVQAGARTGLSAVVVAICMLLAMFFQPVVNMVMGSFSVDGVDKFPTIAPALIVVGAIMMRAMRDIEWDDITEALPAFLVVVTIPLAYSIADGIAIGFISYAVGKFVSGRPKECPLLVYVFAALFVLKFALPQVG